jgi:hypothetical protein
MSYSYIYADNTRELALCVRQARAEAHVHLLHVQVWWAWIQGAGVGAGRRATGIHRVVILIVFTRKCRVGVGFRHFRPNTGHFRHFRPNTGYFRPTI